MRERSRAFERDDFFVRIILEYMLRRVVLSQCCKLLNRLNNNAVL